MVIPWEPTTLSLEATPLEMAALDVREFTFQADQPVNGVVVQLRELLTLAPIVTGVETLLASPYASVTIDGAAAGLVRHGQYELSVQMSNAAGRKWTWTLPLTVVA